MLEVRVKKSRRGRALIAGAADQAVVSFYSLAALVVAARHLAPEQLGVFTSAMVVYQVLIVVARSLNGEPLVVLISDSVGGDYERRALVGSVISSLPLSVLGGVLFVCADSSFWQAIAVCLMCAPMIVGYDTLRYRFIATLGTDRLLLMDVAVVFSQVAALSAILTLTDDSSLALLGISLVYLVPLSVSLCLYRVSIGHALSWYRTSREYGLSFFFESIWGAILQWVLVFAIAHYAGLAEAAAFRSVVVIYGVTNVVTNFLRSTVLSVIVSRGGLTTSVALRDGAIMSGLIALTIMVSALILVLMPDSVGRLLLGETWPLAAPYILIGALTRFSAAIEAVPGVLLRAARATWSVVRVRVVAGVLGLCVCPLATIVWGVYGAFYSMAVMSWVLSLMLAWLLVSRLADVRRQSAAE